MSLFVSVPPQRDQWVASAPAGMVRYLMCCGLCGAEMRVEYPRGLSPEERSAVVPTHICEEKK